MKNSTKKNVLATIFAMVIAAAFILFICVIPQPFFEAVTAIISGIALGWASSSIGYKFAEWVSKDE